jgi:hypothetical protein
MDSRKQIYHLMEGVLWRLVGQGTYPDAQGASDRFKKIKTDGGTPRCFYSQFNGFSVLDENNPDQMRIAMSMEQRSKPFPI